MKQTKDFMPAGRLWHHVMVFHAPSRQHERMLARPMIKPDQVGLQITLHIGEPLRLEGYGEWQSVEHKNGFRKFFCWLEVF